MVIFSTTCCIQTASFQVGAVETITSVLHTQRDSTPQSVQRSTPSPSRSAQNCSSPILAPSLCLPLALICHIFLRPPPPRGPRCLRDLEGVYPIHQTPGPAGVVPPSHVVWCTRLSWGKPTDILLMQSWAIIDLLYPYHLPVDAAWSEFPRVRTTHA